MSQSEPLWWHVFGGVGTEGVLEGCWALLIGGESPAPPDEIDQHPEGLEWATYLGSFDHDPTDEEREAMTPEQYRDGGESDG